MAEGYIKLWRKCLESDCWKDPVAWRFWTWCLLKASHCEKDQQVGRQTIHLMPGQFVTGRFTAMKETGLSEQQLRNQQIKHQINQQITIKSTNKYSIISIVNWGDYQTQPTNKTTSKTADKQPAKQPQTRSIKEEKNNNTVVVIDPPEKLNPFSFYTDNFGLLTMFISEQINDLITEYTEEKVLDAMQKSVRQNKRSLKYIEGILRNNGNGRAGRIPAQYTPDEELISAESEGE